MCKSFRRLNKVKKVIIVVLIGLMIGGCFQTSNYSYAAEPNVKIETRNYNEYKVDEMQKENLLKKAKVLKWKDADNTIEINSKFVLIDYETGMYIWAMRTGGGNHADIEALTYESANYFKQFPDFGSWKTRPVLIITEDGNVYCASMNMKYHAGVDGAGWLKEVENRSVGYGKGANYDKIENGLSGHNCLHFKFSRTHCNGGKIHKGHQNNINELEIKINRLNH